MSGWDTFSPEIRAAAGRVCTPKELDALILWNPGVAGYRSVALALDISPSTARDRIERALRKLERELR